MHASMDIHTDKNIAVGGRQVRTPSHSSGKATHKVCECFCKVTHGAWILLIEVSKFSSLTRIG